MDNHFHQNKGPELNNNPNAKKLFDDIFKRVVKNKQKIFLCSREKTENNSLILELWHYRFIHLVSPSMTVLDENDFPKEYIVYSMDYGKLLSLKVNEKGKKVVEGMTRGLDPLSVLDPLVSRVLKGLLKHEKIGGSLRKITGGFLVGMEGVEGSNLNDINYLITNCVIDDIIN